MITAGYLAVKCDMRLIRFIFLIFMVIPDTFGQEKISGSTIYLYSDPDNVKIEIPELHLKTDKDTAVLELKSLSNGWYNITFRERGNRLKTNLNILEPDTFLVYANFYNSEIIAITQKE
jgi:hypothetical protein